MTEPSADRAGGAPAPDPDVTDVPGPPADASDVVVGPIGSARLAEPSKPGIRGADLKELDATAITSAD